RDRDVGRVRVDDGRARVDARERVLRLFLRGRGNVRVALPARDTVERSLDDHRNIGRGHLYSVARVRTRITELLGIEYPIVQAPMGYIARSQLASAVSNAGGLGIIETSSGRLSEVRDEIRKMRELTDKPFGVNIAQLFVRDASIVDFVAENGVTFVTTSAGDPTKYTRALKDAGLTVFHVVPSLRGALKAVDAGVDGLVVEGNEGGGFKAPTGAST